ncbi:MAG: endolytic transglycosylase MltG [Candidatus Saccharimonadales bacterium]
MLISIIAVTFWYTQSIKARTGGDTFTLVNIQSGSGTRQIALQLEQQKVIKSARAFAWYVRLNGIASLQAGEYRLSSKQSVADIATTLSDGKVTTVNVLIPPGQRLDQIIKILEKEGYKEADIEEALQNVRDHPLLRGLPAGAKLEGYLFPETYSIEPSTTAEQLIRTMLDTFEKRITTETRSGIAAQGLTLQQAIILASIIQKEVPDAEVQRTVAQVFLSRLRQGMVLGSDVTYMYAAAMSGEAATPALDSPYNTRRIQGLPPTAISNFNFSALQAVANPTKTDYLYFVAGDDGVTHFSRTLAEHEALVQKYCKKLCG